MLRATHESSSLVHTASAWPPSALKAQEWICLDSGSQPIRCETMPIGSVAGVPSGLSGGKIFSSRTRKVRWGFQRTDIAMRFVPGRGFDPAIRSATAAGGAAGGVSRAAVAWSMTSQSPTIQSSDWRSSGPWEWSSRHSRRLARRHAPSRFTHTAENRPWRTCVEPGGITSTAPSSTATPTPIKRTCVAPNLNSGCGSPAAGSLVCARVSRPLSTFP